MSSTERKRGFLLYAGLSALIIFRTLPFLLYGHEVLDSDEGLFGLMAKQLSEGRAFPIFGYGTKYIFAFNSWCAAPLMRIWGSSVITLKLPLFFMNLFVGNVLAFLLRKYARLTLFETFLCCLWFAIPSFQTASGLMDACIGGIEPFFFILLIWILRERPITGAFVAGIGMAIRPFVFYGVISILLLKWMSPGPRKAFFRDVAQRLSGTAAGYGLILFLARFSSNYWGAPNPVIHKSIRHMLEDVRGYLANVIPKTIGLQVQRLPNPVIFIREDLAKTGYFNVLGLALTVLGVVLLLLLLGRICRDGLRGWTRTFNQPELRFPFYLTSVGFLSFLVWDLMSPPTADIRYTYLLLFGFAGAYALMARLGAKPLTRKLAMIFVLGCAVNSIYANALAWKDMIALEREHPTEDLIGYLKSRGVSAALIEYHSAYNIAFLSNESITVADYIPGRIDANETVFFNTPLEHKVRVEREPCQPDHVKFNRWYICP